MPINTLHQTKQFQVTKDPLSNHVEVKSEPLPMMTAHHEDVPGNVGSVSVTEFITSEGDLSLPSLPHGMSTQFMFPPDPSPAGEILQSKVMLIMNPYHQGTLELLPRNRQPW